jgi:hypothetical protein
MDVFYDVKVYEDREEKETIRGLTSSQVTTIEQIFLRSKIKFVIKTYETEKKEEKTGMFSNDCKTWYLTHNNCYGCECEKICADLVKLKSDKAFLYLNGAL